MYLNASIFIIKIADRENVNVAMDHGIIVENGISNIICFYEGS